MRQKTAALETPCRSFQFYNCLYLTGYGHGQVDAWLNIATVESYPVAQLFVMIKNI